MSSAAGLRLVIDIRGVLDPERLKRTLKKVEAGYALQSPELGEALRGHLRSVGDAHWQWTIECTPLVMDAGSLTVFYQALAETYGRDAWVETTEEAAPYSQFIEWQQALQDDESAAAAREYWTSTLRIGSLQAPTFPRLAYRQSRPNAAAPVRQSVVHELHGATVQAIDRAAFLLNEPGDVVLQAAWWALLARLCDQAAFVGGWQHDCRFDYAHFANTPGVFERVLPLVLAVWPDERFGTWLRRVAQALGSARQWQEWWPVDEPLETAHRAVGFAVASKPATKTVAADCQWSVEHWPDPLPGFELALQAERDAEGRLARLTLHYAVESYEEDSIRVLLEQYVTLLGVLPEHTATKVFELPITSKAQQETMLALNHSRLEVGSRSVGESIADWSSSTPDHIALLSAGTPLSYGELNGRVLRLAGWLTVQGVECESTVALCLPRGIDLIVAVLAVMRAGGTFVPLDPQWPERRRAAILAAVRPRVVIADGDSTAGEFNGSASWLSTDDLRDLCTRQSTVPRPSECRIDLKQAAYILFTSGSTGEPKGVIVEHGHLLNYVAAATQALELKSCRRLALTSTVAADLGYTVLFGALFNGATLVIAQPSDLDAPTSFAGFLHSHQIDCLKIVPSHLAALLDGPGSMLPGTVILGGEAASPSLLRKMREIAPDCRVYNHYGPTETTVGVLTHAATQQDNGAIGLPLTRALANCEVFILDSEGRLAPVGAAGELYVGGAQVCRGYLDSTRDSQLATHLPAQPTALYRTGDVARYLPNGGLMLMGRRDGQLKVQGFRVAPAEVEAALLALPGVCEAAVLGRPSPSPYADSELAAFVSLDGSNPAQDLQAALAAVLPAAMVPTHIYVWPEMPRLANGKVDRRALADAQGHLTEDRSASAADTPQNDVQAVLAAQMAELLGRERLSVAASFLEAGGNSLLAIRLGARIGRLFAVDIPPGLVFDHPTPAALAAALRSYETQAGELERRAHGWLHGRS